MKIPLWTYHCRYPHVAPELPSWWPQRVWRELLWGWGEQKGFFLFLLNEECFDLLFLKLMIKCPSTAAWHMPRELFRKQTPKINSDLNVFCCRECANVPSAWQGRSEVEGSETLPQPDSLVWDAVRVKVVSLIKGLSPLLAVMTVWNSEKHETIPTHPTCAVLLGILGVSLDSSLSLHVWQSDRSSRIWHVWVPGASPCGQDGSAWAPQG